jgi:hypothetical protein
LIYNQFLESVPTGERIIDARGQSDWAAVARDGAILFPRHKLAEARTLFKALQRQPSGRFADGQLLTLRGDHSRAGGYSHRGIAVVNRDLRGLNAGIRCVQSDDVHGSADPQVLRDARFKLRI